MIQFVDFVLNWYEQSGAISPRLLKRVRHRSLELIRRLEVQDTSIMHEIVAEQVDDSQIPRPCTKELAPNYSRAKTAQLRECVSLCDATEEEHQGSPGKHDKKLLKTLKKTPFRNIALRNADYVATLETHGIDAKTEARLQEVISLFPFSADKALEGISVSSTGRISIYGIPEPDIRKLNTSLENKLPVSVAAREAGVPYWKAKVYCANTEYVTMAPTISEDKKARLREALYSGHTLREAAQYAKVGYTTARKYSLRMKLNRSAHYGLGSETEKKQQLMTEAHERRLSLSQAAKYAGVAVLTLRRFWCKKGLAPNYLPGGRTKTA